MDPPDSIQLDTCRVDLTRRVAHRLDGDRRLSPTEARLLAYLAEHAGQVLSKEQLLQDVWGYRAGVVSRTVFSTIDRVRKKIEVDPKRPRNLITEAGGYRLVMAPPQGESSDAAAVRPRLSPIAPNAVGHEPFIGRLPELARLRAGVDAGVSLTSLVGPGGSGKTRLAAELCTQVEKRLEGGVLLVELEGVRQAPQLWARCAERLGLPRTSDPTRIRRSLQARSPMLLVLDDLDHLSTDGREGVGTLSEVKGLRCLCTTRNALGIAGEKVLSVDSLPPGDARTLLLSHRAAAGGVPSDHEIALLDALCEALDRLPLALRLAAPWLSMFSPEQLLQRTRPLLDLSALGGGPGRHASLRACISTSWNQLEAGDARALTMLALIGEPFPADLAEEVLGDDPGAGLARLDRLLSRSLLSRATSGEQPRFRLLASIRSFALERLDPADEKLMRSRFLLWAKRTLQAELPSLAGPDPAPATARVLGMLPLTLAAIDHAAPQEKAALVGALFPAFQLVGFDDQLRALVDEAAAVATGDVALEARLNRADVMLRGGEQAVEELREIRTLARDAGQTSLQVRAGIVLGIAHRSRGELSSSHASLQEAASLASANALHRLHGRALLESAAVHRRRGEHREALALLQVARKQARKARSLRLEMIVSGSVGANQRQLGRLVEAETSLRRALLLAEKVQFHENAAHLRCNLANVLLMGEHYAEAERLLSKAMGWYRTHGALRSEGYALQAMAFAHMGRGQLRAAGRRAVEAATTFSDAGDAMGSAYCTGLLGRVLHASGDPEQALLRYETAAEALNGSETNWLSGQFHALAAAAAADAGQDRKAEELAERARSQLGSHAKAPALMQFVDRFFEAAEAGETEALRERIGSPALDVEVLW